jgi:hypothetical protein
MIAETLAYILARAFRSGDLRFDIAHALYAAPECRCRQCKVTRVANAYYDERVARVSTEARRGVSALEEPHD